MGTVASNVVGTTPLTGALTTGVAVASGVAPTIISEICAPALLLGMQLRSATGFGEIETLRRRSRDLLDGIERSLEAARVAPNDITSISFALVAFLDESVSQSSCPRRDEWVAAPMCFDRFQRFDGGEEFFNRLTNLLATRPLPIDVVQIYLLCLTLGFKGKYGLRPPDDLQNLVATVSATLRAAGEQTPRPLAPNAVPTEVVSQAVRQIPVWVFAAAAAVIACVVYFILSLMLHTEDVSAIGEFLRRR